MLGACLVYLIPLEYLCSSASLQQVRLTPPCSCGFYDGLLILLLQLLTQVQVCCEIGEKQREELGVFQSHWRIEVKKQPMLAHPLTLLLTLLA